MCAGPAFLQFRGHLSSGDDEQTVTFPGKSIASYQVVIISRLVGVLVLHTRAESCLTLCDPTDCSPPRSFFVHEIFQARILEWVAISSSSESSRSRDQTPISCTTAGSLPVAPPGTQIPIRMIHMCIYAHLFIIKQMRFGGYHSKN